MTWQILLKQNTFSEFLKVDDAKGQGLFDELLDILKILDLDIGGLRGSGYDNGSSIKGKHNVYRKQYQK